MSHAAFSSPKAILSVGIALVGVAIAGFLVEREFGPLRHLTQRSRLARGIYAFLLNKYYLDTIYEKGVVGGVSGPIAPGQPIGSTSVSSTGSSTASAPPKPDVATGLVHKHLDQQVIDGAVNLSGRSAEDSGQALRPLQSGKVQQYGALLFGAAAIGVLILVITV